MRSDKWIILVLVYPCAQGKLVGLFYKGNEKLLDCLVLVGDMILYIW